MGRLWKIRWGKGVQYEVERLIQGKDTHKKQHKLIQSRQSPVDQSIINQRLENGFGLAKGNLMAPKKSPEGGSAKMGTFSRGSGCQAQQVIGSSGRLNTCVCFKFRHVRLCSQGPSGNCLIGLPISDSLRSCRCRSGGGTSTRPQKYISR